MKVSACIITYNHQDYIRECLEGALAQIVDFDYEIVIGEDKSTDGTFAICEEFAAKYPGKIRLINREHNLGMIGNWVETIKECTGKYVAICEGDDYWTDPLKLQKQVELIESDDQLTMVYTKAMVYSQIKNEVLGETGGRVRNFHDLLEYNPIPTLTVMFRKYQYKKIHDHDSSNSVMLADLPIWLHMSYYGKLGFIDEISSLYRLQPESASQSSDVGKQIDFMDATLKVRMEFLESIGACDKIATVQNMHFIKLSTLRLLPVYPEVSRRCLNYFKENSLKAHYIVEKIKLSLMSSRFLLNFMYNRSQLMQRVLNKIIK